MTKKMYDYKDFRLDVGCGKNKQEGFIGMNKLPLPSVDVVHDLEDVPWPFIDASADVVLMSNVMEKIVPSKVILVFNEIWRIMKPAGQLMVATPYAGSWGGYQDPLNYRPGYNPSTFEYFDPSFSLYEVYEPLPWRIVQLHYEVGDCVNVVMEAMKRTNGQPAKIKVEKKESAPRIKVGVYEESNKQKAKAFHG